VSQAGDDAIALWKAGRPGFGARREFRDQRAVAGDALGQFFVIARVDPVEPAAQHRDRRAPGGERTFVAGGVDAERETAGDREPGAREEGGELARGGATSRGGVAAAHHGELRLREDADVAAHKEHGRRIGRFAKQGRVVGRGGRQQRDAGGIEPAKVRIDERVIGRRQPVGGAGS
jgi:hypothetical protein